MSDRTHSVAITDRRDPTPIYFKLQMKLRTAIEAGKWEPGKAIPTERRLAESHGVSIGTVKKALLNLVNEGYLYRVQGRGTFVTDTTIRRENLRYYRFIADFTDKEAELEMKLISLERVGFVEPAGPNLGIESDKQLYKLKRLFISQGQPLIYTVSFLPVDMFPGLDEFPRSKFEKITLFTALEQSYGMPTIYNRELMSAVLAEQESAEALQIEPGAPLMLIKMLAFTYKDTPYEYRLSYCRTDSRSVFREF